MVCPRICTDGSLGNFIVQIKITVVT
uniref:Uncharacterized protein n=1 Tax=Anguilla anguilla TaxID=7936 RepID=A0A0E9SZP0_ANGAN